MYTISMNKYEGMLRQCYNTKIPLFVYGSFGIGKTDIPEQLFKKIAKEEGREFVNWNHLTIEEKRKTIANAKDYFVFCTQMVGSMDTTDLRGIPNMIESEILELIPFSWIVYFSQPEAGGALFFDELNLAPPAVAGQAYQVIHKREVADRKLSERTFVFGAGNKLTDRAYVYDMPLPLRDRFAEVEVEPSSEIWTKWAMANDISPHLIAFVQWKPSYLFKIEEKSSNKSCTPRGLERASNMIKGLDVTSNEAHSFISVSVGEAFATEFQAYCKYYKQLDWNEILTNPSSISNFEVDKLWAVIGGLTERFKKISNSKKNQGEFDKYMGVVMAMPHEDFSVVCLRMLMEGNAKKFTERMQGCSKFKEIASRYGKFIID